MPRCADQAGDRTSAVRLSGQHPQSNADSATRCSAAGACPATSGRLESPRAAVAHVSHIAPDDLGGYLGCQSQLSDN
jgi:hypothetical protein